MADVAQITTLNQFSNALSPLYALTKNGLSVNALRTNNILRKDEWKAFDAAVIDIFRHGLTGIADLRSAGLTRNLGGLGVMIDEWEMMSDMTSANVDMSGITPGQKDRIEFELTGVPIPIIHKDFQVNIRHLEASRRLGNPIDTTQSEVAARKVREMMETMIFNGLPQIASKQYIVYGYTTFPHRNQMTLSGIWGAAGSTPVDDVLSMLQVMNDNNLDGPFQIYVPNSFFANLYKDYDTTKPGTIAQRIMQIPSIRGIKQTSYLDGNADTAEVLMVQLTRDVVDLSIGSDVVVIEWQTLGGMQSNFKVFCAMAPRIKRDEENRCGIVHAQVDYT